MFSSRISVKKFFQKPNILRRRLKASVTPTKSKTSSNQKVNQTVQSQSVPSKIGRSRAASIPSTTIPNNTLKTKTDNETTGTNSKSVGINSLICGQNPLNNNKEPHKFVNVELSVNDHENYQEKRQCNGDDWCIKFTETPKGILVEDVAHASDSDENSIIMKMIPMSEITSTSETKKSIKEETNRNIPVQNLPAEYLPISIMKFKCDFPDCTKKFKSEDSLKRHKGMHNSDKSTKEMKIECPARKEIDGVMKPCAKFFFGKDKLDEHLSKEHSPSDAPYRCNSCERRFFWEVGMRAHERAGCGRSGLACTWPGCGAAFKLPCRLKEHVRTHTGDKPYACSFPNCGWSFRTASKLGRHTRRHTGERRHTCVVCQRAFLRPEHLRDHLARHHRPQYTCPMLGCQRKFVNISSYITHMKKKHQEEPYVLEKSTTAISPVVEPKILVDSKPTEVIEIKKRVGIKKNVLYSVSSDNSANNEASPESFHMYHVSSVTSEDNEVSTDSCNVYQIRSKSAEVCVVKAQVDLKPTEINQETTEHYEIYQVGSEIEELNEVTTEFYDMIVDSEPDEDSETTVEPYNVYQRDSDSTEVNETATETCDLDKGNSEPVEINEVLTDLNDVYKVNSEPIEASEATSESFALYEDVSETTVVNEVTIEPNDVYHICSEFAGVIETRTEQYDEQAHSEPAAKTSETTIDPYDVYEAFSDPPDVSEVTTVGEEVGDSDSDRGETERRRGEGEEGGQAARTHCTWPLLNHQSHSVSHHDADIQLLHHSQTEHLEGGENNIYTVRSDLFLHGNVLTNDDNVSMEGASGAGPASMDTDLGLLDTHHHIDLLQEELMYTDAEDESSYRVFLLSGEEIQTV